MRAHTKHRTEGYARRDHDLKTRGPRPAPWRPPALRHEPDLELRLAEQAIRLVLGRSTLPWRP